MDQSVEVKTLNREDAVALWKQGRETWNKWVEENPVYNIDFSGHVFDEPKIINGRKVFDFKAFKFPDGDVSFMGTEFSEGHVDFDEAQFGKGLVNFHIAQFGEGLVNFHNAQFGEGDVSFNKAQFGEGGVNFIGAQFSKGDVNFMEAQFGKGDVGFDKAQFGEGLVSFSYTEFNKGIIYFDDANFSECRKVIFEGSEISSSCRFLNNNFKSLSFFGTKIFGTLLFINTSAKVPPDLRGTEIKHHLVINDLNVEGFDPQDISSASKFQRLKEIAIDSKYHQGEQNFFALEQKAIRQHELKGWQKIPNYLYEIWSDYGRSISRPLLRLLGVWLLFAFVFCIFTLKNDPTNLTKHSINSLIFSMSQLLPFSAWSRTSKQEGIDALFNGYIPQWVHFVATFESLLSLLFIFLIGLALRNRFKL